MTNAEGTVGVRISIWRPYVPIRPLAMHTSDASTLTMVGTFDTPVQQEAYSWQTKEDVWGGIVDPDLRLKLNRNFVEAFEPTKSPASRSMRQFKIYLDELESSLSGAEWSTSTEQLEDDDESGCRLNALLAFAIHLRWLFDVFKDTPGASVSVR